MWFLNAASDSFGAHISHKPLYYRWGGIIDEFVAALLTFFSVEENGEECMVKAATAIFKCLKSITN